MSFSEIILSILGVGLIGGMLFMMIRILFLPNPSSQTQQESVAGKKKDKAKT